MLTGVALRRATLIRPCGSVLSTRNLQPGSFPTQQLRAHYGQWFWSTRARRQVRNRPQYEGPEERSAKAYLLPLHGIERMASPASIRDSLTLIGTNSGITSAILGGVAVTGLMARSNQQPPLQDSPSILASLSDPQVFLHPGWGDIFAQPLLLTATFISLHNIMTCLCVSSYPWALPLQKVPEFARLHAVAIGSCGWLVAPNLACLSSGLVCLAESSYPALAPYGIGLFLGLGVVNIAQSFLFLRSSFRLKREFLASVNVSPPFLSRRRRLLSTLRSSSAPSPSST